MSLSTTRPQHRGALAAALAALLALLVAAPAGAAEPVPTPIEGFDGVLGLAVGADGSVYAAENFGGQLTRIDPDGSRTVLAQGAVAGVDAIGRGNVWFTTSTPPEMGGDGDAYLSRVLPNGKIQREVNLTAYEAANNPDAGQTYGLMGAGDCIAGIADPAVRDVLGMVTEYAGIVESNPYAVAIDRGSVLVADAAANSILRVSQNGRSVSTVAVLPPQDPITVDADLVGMLAGLVGDVLGREDVVLPDCLLGTTFVGEFVPTDIEVGPDGAYYVTSLPGMPELPGTGSVWRIDPSTGAMTRVASGFSGAVDLAITADGTIYVAELFGPGVSIVRDGAVVDTIPVPLPGAVEVGPDGRVYAAIGTFFGPGAGSIVALTP